MRVSSWVSEAGELLRQTFCHERLDAVIQALSFLDPHVQLALPPSSTDVLWIIQA